jgi:predicted glycoside hydrolase/deacetylase ChbG (UPF0249 family)
MTTRYLIVNADDLGASPGVNRGILEAHQRGIVTSASLMVDAPGAAEAARLGLKAPRLSLGLHVDLGGAGGNGHGGGGAANGHGADGLLLELTRQIGRFVELVGRPPSHIDSHRDVHRDPRHLPAFAELARRWGVPLRGYSPVRCLSKFYGQWAGESHPEQLSVESLAHILESGVGAGATELICHPGYGDGVLVSSYLREREVEIATLCDPRMSRVLAGLGIELVNHDAFWRATPGPQ